MSESKADQFLAALEACGWFEHLSPDAAEEVRHSVGAAGTWRLWAGLVATAADSAYLLEERPWAALAAQFARASHGAFAPDTIEETAVGDTRRLEFSVGGRHYGLDLSADADEPPRVFYDIINQAMAETPSPLRFLELYQLGWGPIPGFALAHPDAFAKALEAKLLPASEEETISEEDLEGFAATVKSVLMRGETYRWSLEGELVAEISVPGEFEEIIKDERSKGQGMQTVLAYEGCGTLLLICSGPADGFLTLPQGFEKEDAAERPDRSLVIGRTTIAENPMRWRLDRVRGAPVHLLYTVTEDMAPYFDAALDSFRLLERTPKAEAIFASCLVAFPKKKSQRRR